MHRSAQTAIVLSLLTGFALPCQAGVELPARFEANRIVLVPRTADGTTLEFYTDSGGGFNAISPAAASRLMSRRVGVREKIPFPEFDPAASIPSNPLFEQGRLVVADFSRIGPYDGFLGGRWFGDRIWELDYLRQRIALHDRYSPSAEAAAHAVRLGFQTDASGARTTHFASLPIEVDEREILVLFDTGATATITDGAADAFDVPSGTSVGTSFITQSIFEDWMRAHADWPVVPDADRGVENADMIRVPAVTVGGHTVGPVWFAVRPDRNFTEGMSQWTDRTVHGAIGGSAFRYFRIVIDYPAAIAWFFRD